MKVAVLINWSLYAPANQTFYFHQKKTKGRREYRIAIGTAAFKQVSYDHRLFNIICISYNFEALIDLLINFKRKYNLLSCYIWSFNLWFLKF